MFLGFPSAVKKLHTKVVVVTMFPYSQMMKTIASVLLLAAMALSRPQVDISAFTPAQQLVIRQHNAIAQANAPNPIAAVPGFAEHQQQLNAVLALQGINPGQLAFDQAIARVAQQEAELASLSG